MWPSYHHPIQFTVRNIFFYFIHLKALTSYPFLSPFTAITQQKQNRSFDGLASSLTTTTQQPLSLPSNIDINDDSLQQQTYQNLSQINEAYVHYIRATLFECIVRWIVRCHDEKPPAFATEAPKIFDTRLPSLTKSGMDNRNIFVQ